MQTQGLTGVHPTKANKKKVRRWFYAATGLKMICPRSDFLVRFDRGRETISTSLSNAMRNAISRSMEYSRKFPLNSRDTSG